MFYDRNLVKSVVPLLFQHTLINSISKTGKKSRELAGKNGALFLWILGKLKR
jgi:hypothetical protein